MQVEMTKLYSPWTPCNLRDRVLAERGFTPLCLGLRDSRMDRKISTDEPWNTLIMIQYNLRILSVALGRQDSAIGFNELHRALRPQAPCMRVALPRSCGEGRRCSPTRRKGLTDGSNGPPRSFLTDAACENEDGIL